MNKEIRFLIENRGEFPSLSDITLKVFEMSSDPDVSSQEISKVISGDVSLATRIMKVVNSAFYGSQKKINNIEQAISILGIHAICNVLLTLSFIDLFLQKKSSHFTYLFRWSLCSGITADLISAFVGKGSRSVAFLVSFLQNLGQFIFMRYLGDRYVRLIDEAKKRGIELAIIEREVMGIDYMEAGAMVAERWNMPEAVALSIKYGGNISGAYEQNFNKTILNLIETAYLSGLVAEVYNSWNKALNIEIFKLDFSKIFKVDKSTAEDILSSIPYLIEDLGSNYDIEIGKLPSYEELLNDSALELIESQEKYKRTYSEFRLMRKEVFKKNQKINELNLELLKSKKLIQKLSHKSPTSYG